MRAWLLILSVDEGHVGQSDERKNVAEIRLLIIEALGRSTRTESFRSGRVELDCLSRPDDLVDPCFQWRGDGEVVHGRADDDIVGLAQFFDESIRRSEHQFLLGRVAGRIGVNGLHLFVGNVRQMCSGEIALDNLSARVLLAP